MTIEEIHKIVLSKNPEAKEILARQRLVSVRYIDYEKVDQVGQIVVDAELADEVEQLFKFCLTINYPFAKIIPIQERPYFSDDDLSMKDNNSSGFNYRYIAGTKRLSPHGFGFAIDLNPFDNPVQANGITIAPKGAVRNLGKFEVFTSEHPVVEWLKERGWDWLGERAKPNQDYHHFQKVLATDSYLAELTRQFQNQEIEQELYKQLLTTAQINYEKI